MVAPTPFRLSEFKSAYGPKYQYQPNFHGFTSKMGVRLGAKSAAYGAAAGVALIFYASGIPRVKKDILQNLPFIGGYFIKEVHPQDNPF